MLNGKKLKSFVILWSPFRQFQIRRLQFGEDCGAVSATKS
jgi:hypothetical protein